MSRLRAGDKVQLTIESIVPGGDGLGRYEGMPIFVARTASGDVAEIEIFDARKDFARGRVAKLIQPSTQRVEPPCKLFKVCGGCQWQHVNYEAQLNYKQEIVRQAIRRINNLSPDTVRSTIGAADNFFYRNKVQFPVKHPANSRRLLAGYYEQDSHELVNIKHCPVQPQTFDELLGQVKELAEANNITAYNEHMQKGLLRHICMRQGANGQLLLTLVVNLTSNKELPAGLKQLADKIKSDNAQLAGICINFNDKPGNKIYGEVTQILSGQDFIEEHLASHLAQAPQSLRLGLNLKVSATSFFQIHHAQTEALLDVILETVLTDVPSSTDTLPVIVDAYAGVGTIALWLAGMASRVVAIEESPSAAKDAVENIKNNQASNVEFHRGKVEEVFPRLNIKPDILILDPPRKGVARTVIEHTLKLKPKKVIYVSCNPATLARDLTELAEKYKILSIQPIDMFPQTFHIESVSVLELA
jgi:23S rRNA (uracil1939-C5)-methyltransferase